MGKRRAKHPFGDNPVIDGFLEWMDAPEGQQSIEASDLVFAALAHAGVDARQRNIVWADGERLSIGQSAARIHAGHPDMPRELIETHVVGWLESCVPEAYSERQLEELDRLIEPWLDEYERRSPAVTCRQGVGENSALSRIYMGRSKGAGGFLRKWLGQYRPRGPVIPFEGPALHRVRVCEDEREGLIAILRDFANNGSVYIVPWSSLPLMGKMTDHDAALHKGVGESKPSTPADVRAMVSQLSLVGALGPEAKAGEVERTQVNRTLIADVELILILHLLSVSGTDLSAMTADVLLRGATDAKAIVAAAAAAVGVGRQDIYPRVSELAKLLVPVGLPTIKPGWLRVERDEIEAFGQGCISRAAAGSPEITEALMAFSRAASTTAQLSDTVLSMIDYALLDISTTIRQWQIQRPIIGQVIDRLSLLLDEWPSLMTMVRDALCELQGDPVVRLRALLATLPQAPEINTSEENDRSGSQQGSALVSRELAGKLSTIWSACRR